DSYKVIVVDDGSTDKTGSIAQGYAVRYIRQENQGPAVARNKGVQEAKGDIVLFTDSDCVSDKNWIGEMVRPFDAPEVVAVKGVYKTNQKSLVARFAQIEFEERYKMLKRADSIDMIDTYSAGFRREIFLKAGGFDASFPSANNEDTELSYRMSKLGFKMVFNPEAKVYHLNHPDSIRRYARLKFWRGYWRMVVYKRFPGKIVKDTYTPQALKIQILFLYLSLITLLMLAIWQKLTILFLFGIIAFVFSTLPFTLFAFKKNTMVGILSLFFLLIRAGSLGAGVIWGLLGKRRL
ncbi:MAG: glycosyltransferase, partial [Candidatus Omnitrophica bacterium]|nr:glycosyltransferase [Candidatus Omnitrophota bacterium]